MVDREKVIKALEGCLGYVPCNECSYKIRDDYTALKCRIDMMRDCLEVLKEQPEIVRCKDCKHSKDEYGGMFCPKFGFVHQEDWFCADGERRTE